jgi:predicted ATPase
MADSGVFVARENEINRLTSILKQTLDGKLQVCLISGEAGSGKSTLLNRFSQIAETSNDKLLFLIGTCNAQTGISDPYLPFRHILAQLIGDTSNRDASITPKGENRLNEILRTTGRTLVEIAPELIGALIPGGGILAALGRMTAKERGMLKGLEKRAEEATKQDVELGKPLIMYQVMALLKEIAKEHPLVLALDDLHWGDESSIALFFEIARGLQNSPIMLIGLYRGDYIDAGRQGKRHPMQEVINTIQGYEGDVTIDLDAVRQLSGRAFVDEFLDTEPNKLDEKFRAELYQRTNGHPLFTVELVRLMQMQKSGDLLQDDNGDWIVAPNLSWGKMPTPVEAVIKERIERLEKDLRETLTLASVEGYNFTANILAQLRNIDESKLIDELSELDKQHKLVQEVGIEDVGQHSLFKFAFSHALFHQYLYTSLNEAKKTRLHRAVGLILEELYADNIEQIAQQLAHHFSIARDKKKSIKYTIQAAIQARKVGNAEQAIDILNQLLQKVDENDYQLIGYLHNTLAETHNQIGQVAHAEHQYQKAIEILNQIAPNSFLAQSYTKLSRIWRITGRFDEALVYLSKAQELTSQLGDEINLANALREKTIVLSELGHADEELKELRSEALQLSKKNNDYEGIARSLNTRAILLRGEGGYDGIRLSKEALKYARKAGDSHTIGIMLDNLAVGLYWLGQYEDSIKYNNEALILAKRTADKNSQMIRHGEIALTYLLMNQTDKYIEHSKVGYELAQELNNKENLSYQSLRMGLFYLIQNDIPNALKILQQGIDVKYLRSLHALYMAYAIALLRSHHIDDVEVTARLALEYVEKRISASENYQHKFDRGFILAILAVVDVEQKDVYLAQAIAQFHEVITSYKDQKGSIHYYHLYLQELMKADKDMILAPIVAIFKNAMKDA